MENNMRYCTKCGAKLEEGANFCGGCGTRLAQASDMPASPQTQPPSQIQGEKALAAIPVQIQEKLVVFKAYVLVLTESKVILVRVTNEMMKREAQRAAEEAKTSGKGFLGRMAATAFSGYNISRRYLDMTAEQILSEGTERLVIHNNEVRKVKFSESRVITDSDNNTSTQQGKIVFDTPAKKYKITLTTQGDERQLKALLKSLFGARLSGRWF